MARLFLPTLLVLISLVFLHVVDAQVMTSDSYQIQSDSVNFGGGLSTSSNYSLESTGGEIATGPSDSTTYRLRAGYQQMQEVYLALSNAADITMTPDIPGVGGGESNGSTTLTATTDSPSGYQLTIEFSDTPAMQSVSSSIADYVPVGADPDLHFTTGSSDSHFGFSPFGTHVVQRYQTDGADCNVSSSASTTACWDRPSTTPAVIAESSSPNLPDGTDTTIYFKVGVGGGVVQLAGSYVATSTVTLLAL